MAARLRSTELGGAAQLPGSSDEQGGGAAADEDAASRDRRRAQRRQGFVCAMCGARDSPAKRLLKCGQCASAWYCSKEHQREHWRAGHQDACKTTRNMQEQCIQEIQRLSPRARAAMWDGEKCRVKGRIAEAARLFRIAADEGNISGTANLACLLYAGGDGLAADIPAALQLWRECASRGDGLSAFNVARHLLHPPGGAKALAADAPEAVRLLRQSAATGDIDAAAELSLCLKLGVGCAKDEQEARKWADVARAGGRRDPTGRDVKDKMELGGLKVLGDCAALREAMAAAKRCVSLSVFVCMCVCVCVCVWGGVT
jgi:hypothetical protein